MPSAGCPTTPTSYWDPSTETFINNITFSRSAAAPLPVIHSIPSVLSIHCSSCFLSPSGVPIHILVGDEFHHVQSYYLLLSKPKVKLNLEKSKPQVPSSPKKQEAEKKPVCRLSAGSVPVSVTPSLGVPSSSCRRRTGWSCSTHTPSESP